MDLRIVCVCNCWFLFAWFHVRFLQCPVQMSSHAEALIQQRFNVALKWMWRRLCAWRSFGPRSVWSKSLGVLWWMSPPSHLNFHSEFPKLKGRSPGESLLCKGFSRLLQCGYTSLSGQLRSSTVAFPAHTSYSVSKAAIDQVTRHLAVELGPHQIRSNAVKPTVVLTEMGRTAWPDGAPETKDTGVDFFHLTFVM